MREFKIQLGKVLIAFSIVIIFLGLSLNIDNKKYQSDIVVSGNDNELPDTTIEVDNTNNLPVDNTNSTGNNSDNNTGSDTGGNADTTNNNTVTSPVIDSGDTKVNPSISVDTSLETSNNNLRNNIQNSYGVTIKYGDEISGYQVGGLDVVPFTNEKEIENTLKTLDYNMRYNYPSNFFGEIRNGGLPLTIYLIKNYKSGGKDTNVTGITEKNARNEVIISIALDFPFEDSFNHEMYHYMEHYINSRGGTYSNWNSYNPNGFIYNHIDPQYSYDYTLKEDSYFVNSYAQTFEYEDRASTFEYMMAKEKISPLNQGNNIWKKAKLMCEMIDYYFITVNDYTIEHWERFVYQ